MELQQAGWEIAVEFYQMDFTYRLMLHHKALDLHAVSNQQLLGSIDNITQDISKIPFFEVVYVARSLHSVRVPELDFNSFQTIDARPMYTKMEIQRVEDMNVFNVKGRQEQVLVDKADMSVVEHLEAIKALQSDKQKEIRNRMLNEHERPHRMHIVAQLVHLEAAA